ncbi:hypothetical protein diail_8433 [Diaporthe ilicicola]|nr:hypothetical protein diail_8433 [Diaporthe ilicicola]
MADAQSKAEKLAAARKKAEELKKKKAAGAKVKKDKAPADKKEDEAAAIAEPAEEKSKEEAQEEEEAPPVEPSTPAEAEPTTTASPFAPTDTESPTRQGATTSESTAELETKLLELEKELDAVKGARDEAQLTADALEKKVVSLELLHKEDESQINRLQKDLAEVKNETVDLKDKLQKAEAEALRLSKQENQDRGGTDNDHLDELEDEERKKLEARIRQLEAENSDLQRGIWQERRRNMQPPMDDGTGQFTNVPLSPSAARKQGGLGDFFTTGLNALTGGGGHEHQEDDGFLDDDEDFDEEAFRKAQEETAKARIERIKEVKRGLKNWEGWRLDLVEGRRGGGEGLGEIFEI